jgi:hypothetical protein
MMYRTIAEDAANLEAEEETREEKNRENRRTDYWKRKSMSMINDLHKG